jgi:hypothetical protein
MSNFECQQGRLDIPLRNTINTNSSFKEKSRDLWNELEVGDRWAKKLPKMLAENRLHLYNNLAKPKCTVCAVSISS